MLKNERNLNFTIRSAKHEISEKSYGLKGKKLIDSVINDDFEDNKAIYPDLLEKVMNKLTFEAQKVKNNLKRLKGLNVDENFVFVNVHVCEFCKREFSKPCALGGHISKVHRGKGAKMDE